MQVRRRFLAGAQATLAHILFQAAEEAVVAAAKQARKSDLAEDSAVVARKSFPEALVEAEKPEVMVAAADGQLQVAEFQVVDLRILFPEASVVAAKPADRLALEAMLVAAPHRWFQEA